MKSRTTPKKAPEAPKAAERNGRVDAMAQPSKQARTNRPRFNKDAGEKWQLTKCRTDLDERKKRCNAKREGGDYIADWINGSDHRLQG